MNTRLSNIGKLGLLLALAAPFHAMSQTNEYISQYGSSKVRVEGTSSFHDWQVESTVLGGKLLVGPDFPTSPGQSVKSGKVDATVEFWVPVSELKSVEKDGKPYSSTMDEKTRGYLKQDVTPRIAYHLSELILKEAPKSADAPYVFDSTGNLVVAGVTNKISMPVNITPTADKKLKITGDIKLKMTQFGIKPPELTVLGVGMTVGDDIQVILDWTLKQRGAPAK